MDNNETTITITSEPDGSLPVIRVCDEKVIIRQKPGAYQEIKEYVEKELKKAGKIQGAMNNSEFARLEVVKNLNKIIEKYPGEMQNFKTVEDKLDKKIKERASELNGSTNKAEAFILLARKFKLHPTVLFNALQQVPGVDLTMTDEECRVLSCFCSFGSHGQENYYDRVRSLFPRPKVSETVEAIADELESAAYGRASKIEKLTGIDLMDYVKRLREASKRAKEGSDEDDEITEEMIMYALVADSLRIAKEGPDMKKIIERVGKLIREISKSNG